MIFIEYIDLLIKIIRTCCIYLNYIWVLRLRLRRFDNWSSWRIASINFVDSLRIDWNSLIINILDVIDVILTLHGLVAIAQTWSVKVWISSAFNVFWIGLLKMLLSNIILTFFSFKIFIWLLYFLFFFFRWFFFTPFKKFILSIKNCFEFIILLWTLWVVVSYLFCIKCYWLILLFYIFHYLICNKIIL